MKKHIVIILALLTAAGLASGTEVDETRPAAANGVVEISLLSGNLTIVGWDQAEVRVTGDVAGGMGELTFFTDGNRTVIETEALDDGSAELTVRVPRGSELRADTLSADVTVTGLTGVVGVESLSGEIDVEGEPDEVELSTASGAIAVRAAALRRAEMESMSGTLELDADPPTDARYELATVSGAITVRLPAGASARVSADSFSGTIRNDLGPAAEKASSYLPAQELRFSLGGGSASISVETVSGAIVFARK